MVDCPFECPGEMEFKEYMHYKDKLGKEYKTIARFKCNVCSNHLTKQIYDKDEIASYIY